MGESLLGVGEEGKSLLGAREEEEEDGEPSIASRGEKFLDLE